MSNPLRGVSKTIGLFVAGEFLQTWISPVLITLGGTVIGWSQGVQLFYLYIGAVFLFAVSSSGLLRFSEWRYRNSVTDKLTFHSVRVDKLIDNTGAVKALRLGAVLSNKALFPITYEIESVETSLDKFYPPKKPYTKNDYTIVANGSGWFVDHYISIPMMKPGVVEGELKLQFRYGKKGNRNNMLDVNKHLFFHFGTKGEMSGIDWFDQ